MEDTLTGKTIGKYKIEERLGQGGMAEVYKGYQENLDRYVAIKVMHSFLITEEDFLQRFKREARAMASLSHPNIVRVFDFDVYGEDSYYLVMEYIGGGTLKDKIQSLVDAKEQLPLEQSVRLITEVADALAYAHKRGMVHRDIKPANIMLRQETDQAVLTDFGIVKLVGNQTMAFTATGALIGTPSYMSPEQALGKTGDERVDIYSLGILLFQLVTNQLPYAADTPLAVVMKHVNDPTPLPMTFNPEVPLDLQEVILKAMAKEPEDRFQTAAAMGTALRAIDFAGPKATAVVPSVPPTEESEAASFLEATTAGVTMAAQTAVYTEPQTVAQTPAQSTSVATSDDTAKKPPWALIIGGGLLGLIIIFALLYFTGVIGGGKAPPTAVPEIVAGEETDTPQPTPSATASQTTDAEATEPPDEAATQLAIVVDDLTRAAAEMATPERPTPTATPTNTATRAATATIDATAEFLETCAQAGELVSVVRENTNSSGVFPGVPFNIEWTLRNSGTCPWTTDLQWVYVEGESFGYDGEALPIETAVAAGAEISLVAGFVSPETPGTYESTWQLEDGDGVVFGDPIEFSFFVVPRETATPTPSPTAAATPTSEEVEGQAAFIFSVSSCDYPGGGNDWRCAVTITPYIDGSDEVGQFTVYVFDLPGGQAVEYRGTGPFTHFVQARRCAPYNQEIRVVDDVTATQVSEHLYIDPDIYFEGGCTLP